MFLHNISGVEFEQKLKESINQNSIVYLYLNSFDILFLKKIKDIVKDSKKVNLITTKEVNNVENWQQYFLDFCNDTKSYFINVDDIINQVKTTKELDVFVDNINNLKLTKQQSYSFITIINENETINFNIFNHNFDEQLSTSCFQNNNNVIIDYLNEQNNTYINVFENILNNQLITSNYKQQYKVFLNNYYKENTPHFMYYYNLMHIFKGDINDFVNIEHKNNVTKNLGESIIWNKLYDFQKDGVISAINKLNLFGGCIIADSVGLGKTFTALAVIKYYQNQNKNILVLTPKRLRENWESFKNPYQSNFLFNDKFNYQILNHSDIIRKTGKSGNLDLSKICRENYDLIVIDESHNFRNAYGLDDEIVTKRNRYNDFLNEFIKPGIKTNVLMLSATPINNNFNDLKNQLHLFAYDRDDLYADYGIESINKTFKNVNAFYNQWKQYDKNLKTSSSFLQDIDQNYLKLLNLSSIARSRENINQFIDNENDKIIFPKRLKPINQYSTLSYENMDLITFIYNEMKKLKLVAYSVPRYMLNSKINELKEIIKQNKIKTFDNNEVDESDNDLVDIDNLFDEQINKNNGSIQLLIVNLFKRLESSIHSFKITLNSFLEKAQAFQDFLLGKINFDQYLETNSSLSKIFKKLNSNNINFFINNQCFDIDTALEDINHDIEILNKIDNLTNIQEDQKIINLVNIIDNKIKHPLNANNKKIIIFTAFADTAEYIYSQLENWSKVNNIGLGLITGSNKQNNLNKSLSYDQILDYFSPVSKYCTSILENEKQIDILICTDVVSEGQNLQDCDFLINYDIHWNPVRIVQRFGRIDRIGSSNKQIQMVNFWPTNDIENYINLAQRVYEKSIIGSVSTTGDNIFDTNSNEALEFRKNQIIAMKNGDEFDESENVLQTCDLGYDEFLNDLKHSFNGNIDIDEIIKSNSDLKQILKSPIGLMGCCDEQDKESGIIFLFKQTDLDTKNKNGIYPYYLVHIGWDEKIKRGYKENRKTLELMKKLCFNNNILNTNGINKYKQLTQNFNNMDTISLLANEAIKSIINIENENSQIDSLFDSECFNVNCLEKEKIQLISFIVVI